MYVSPIEDNYIMRQTQLEKRSETETSIIGVTVESVMAKSHKVKEMGKCRTMIMTSRNYSKGMCT